MMIPAGVVEKTIEAIARILKPAHPDRWWNSYYIDDIRRAKELAAKGIHYVDVGLVEGVGVGARYCMMIGGPDTAVEYLDPIFRTIAPGIGDIARTPGREKVGGTAELGYCTVAGTVAGTSSRWWHNGIEYG